MSLFWSIIVEAGQEYSQTVEHSFRLTNVCIAADADLSKESQRTSLMVKTSPSMEEIQTGEPQPSEFVTLCNLSAAKDSVMVDLLFGAGEDVTFLVPKGHTLHLSGNYCPEADEYEQDDEESYAGDQDFEGEDASVVDSQDDESINSEDISEMDSEMEAEYMRLMADYNSADEDSEMDSDDEILNQGSVVKPKIVEVTDEQVSAVKRESDEKPLEASKKQKTVPTKTEKVTPPKTEKASAEPKKAEAKKSEAPKKADKIVDSKNDKPVAKEVKKAESTDKDAGKSERKVLPSGLAITDEKLGDGPVAKPGKRLQMRYIGRFAPGHPTKTNKQFDANTSGKPFAFVLGKGEVIRAWDLGVEGMKVGGTRKIECPSKLAYGKKGAGKDIPPNSDLVFEVKLLSVK